MHDVYSASLNIVPTYWIVEDRILKQETEQNRNYVCHYATNPTPHPASIATLSKYWKEIYDS